MLPTDFLIWIALLILFLGIPLVYYYYMGKASSKSWNLKISKGYVPQVSIIVPMYNENKIIKQKIENLFLTKYPIEKMEIIVVDDGSTDNSVELVDKLIEEHTEFKIKILRTNNRVGKPKALNLALNVCTNNIIAVSDADCFLAPDTLINGLAYLADPSVGAVAGLEVLLNPEQSWVTQTETAYDDLVHRIRIGESKIYSTIIFQGGFGVYKREFLKGFDEEVDDSGTALRITQEGARTLLAPDAVFSTAFPSSWRGKLKVKLRRASHLIKIWRACLVLLTRHRLVLPKKIAVPEIYLHLINPIVFLSLVLMTLVIIIEIPLTLLFILIAVMGIQILKKLRILFFETLSNNSILLVALLNTFLLRTSAHAWKPSRE